MENEMTYAEAALVLGIGERKVARLAAEHGWKAGHHWIDRRKVLLKRALVERFAQKRPKVPA